MPWPSSAGSSLEMLHVPRARCCLSKTGTWFLAGGQRTVVTLGPCHHRQTAQARAHTLRPPPAFSSLYFKLGFCPRPQEPPPQPPEEDAGRFCPGQHRPRCQLRLPPWLGSALSSLTGARGAPGVPLPPPGPLRLPPSLLVSPGTSQAWPQALSCLGVDSTDGVARYELLDAPSFPSELAGTAPVPSGSPPCWGKSTVSSA